MQIANKYNAQKNGRGEMIRTSDLAVPNRAHYQAVLRPVSDERFSNETSPKAE